MPETGKKRTKKSEPNEAKGTTTKAKDVVVQKRSVGRPVEYSDEIADEICWRIAHGEPLVRICQDIKAI